MKSKFYLVMCLVVFVVSLFHIHSQSKKVATVTFLVGKNSLKETKDSRWKTLKQGDSIPEGSILRTGNGSRMTILADGSEFKLAPNTELEVSALPLGKSDGEVKVNKGFTWYNIVKVKGRQFTAKTPTVTAGVRGTSFSAMFDAQKKESKNCICEGSVGILDEKTKKTLLVKAGKGASLSRKGELVEESYKEFMDKESSLPAFGEKIKESPLFANCLSCHTPRGWEYKGILKDEKYSN